MPKKCSWRLATPEDYRSRSLGEAEYIVPGAQSKMSFRATAANGLESELPQTQSFVYSPDSSPCTSSCAVCTMSALMIKAIFRLTEVEKQKIFKLREMGVRPPDIARRFGLSEGVVHKVIQAQRALLQPPKVAPQSELLTSDLRKQEAS